MRPNKNKVFSKILLPGDDGVAIFQSLSVIFSVLYCNANFQNVEKTVFNPSGLPLRLGRVFIAGVR
jgi:hypothetical protein